MEPAQVPSHDEKSLPSNLQAPADNCNPVSFAAVASNICLARPVLPDAAQYVDRARSMTSTNGMGGGGAHNMVLAPSGFNVPFSGLSQYSRMVEQTLLSSLPNPGISISSSTPTSDPSQLAVEIPLVSLRAPQNAPIGILNSHLLAHTITQDALKAMFVLQADRQAEKSALEVQIQTLKKKNSELKHELAGTKTELANCGKAIDDLLKQNRAPYSEPASENGPQTIPKVTNHSLPHDLSDDCKGSLEHTTNIDEIESDTSYHPGLSPDITSKTRRFMKESFKSDNSLNSNSPFVVVKKNTDIKRAPTQVETGSAHKKTKIERDQSSMPCFSTMAQVVFKGGVPLRTEEDDEWLSDFACFVRANCAEAFCATERDVAPRRSSQLISPGQVGIRCIFCSNLPFKQRRSRSCCFPSSMSRIYQSMTMMVREHFSSCTEFPKDVRERYNILKARDGQGSNNSKKHWVKSAQQLGMVDTSSGIKFAKVPKTLTEESSLD